MNPLSVLLERQVDAILDAVPADQLAAFREELELHVMVGSDAEHKLLINWATVHPHTERIVVLKMLRFLGKELATQLDEGTSMDEEEEAIDFYREGYHRILQGEDPIRIAASYSGQDEAEARRHLAQVKP